MATGRGLLSTAAFSIRSAVNFYELVLTQNGWLRDAVSNAREEFMTTQRIALALTIANLAFVSVTAADGREQVLKP